MHTRRRFLRWGLGGLFGVAGHFSLSVLPSAVTRREAGSSFGIEDALARLIPDASSARSVGAEYLRANPGTTVSTLLRAVEPLDLAHELPSGLTLSAQVRSDFESGRILYIGGWMLSQTEVALCALTAIALDNPRDHGGHRLHGDRRSGI
jgi:hypothetical protein